MAPHKPMGAGLELGKLLVLRCGELLLKEKVMMSRARLRLKLRTMNKGIFSQKNGYQSFDNGNSNWFNG